MSKLRVLSLENLSYSRPKSNMAERRTYQYPHEGLIIIILPLPSQAGDNPQMVAQAVEGAGAAEIIMRNRMLDRMWKTRCTSTIALACFLFKLLRVRFYAIPKCLVERWIPSSKSPTRAKSSRPKCCMRQANRRFGTKQSNSEWRALMRR